MNIPIPNNANLSALLAHPQAGTMYIAAAPGGQYILHGPQVFLNAVDDVTVDLLGGSLDLEQQGSATCFNVHGAKRFTLKNIGKVYGSSSAILVTVAGPAAHLDNIVNVDGISQLVHVTAGGDSCTITKCQTHVTGSVTVYCEGAAGLTIDGCFFGYDLHGQPIPDGGSWGESVIRIVGLDIGTGHVIPLAPVIINTMVRNRNRAGKQPVRFSAAKSPIVMGCTIDGPGIRFGGTGATSDSTFVTNAQLSKNTYRNCDGNNPQQWIGGANGTCADEIFEDTTENVSPYAVASPCTVLIKHPTQKVTPGMTSRPVAVGNGKYTVIP